MTTGAERPVTQGMHTVSPAARGGVRKQTVAGRTPGLALITDNLPDAD